MTNDFTAQAQAMREELIAQRRDFHRHPELAFQETRTAGIVAQELTRLGIEVRTGIGRTGVVGLLEGSQGDGPTVLVRADMDALPIQEENAVDYASTKPGVMHACGHDGHVTIALAVAKLLAAERERLRGRVKFVFQPAEEVGLGAQAMVRDGALTDPSPDVTLGLHLWNSLPMGVVGAADGPVMAGASNFTIQISGKGGHAASPHQGLDPVACAAQLVTAFQTIVSRNVDPFDTGVISVTSIKAGEAHNVIPQNAELRGTFRFFRMDVHNLIKRRMAEMTELICRAMGCTSEIIFNDLTRPVINDTTIGAQTRAVFRRIVGEDKIDLTVRTMGAEDVSEFMTETPGMFFFVGAGDVSLPAYYGHHHPRFSIDEESLPLGVALLTSAVASFVLPEG